MRVLDAALNAVWAMEEGALNNLMAIAEREVDATPEALEAYRAKSLANSERARVRNGVAIVDVIGPTFKRANLFTAMSGATSYDTIRTDLQAALDDPKVKSIMLNIDSPGGEASGTSELAQAIFDARGKKPIVAYVGGTGASAAYWTASAADRIVVDATAILGSIGVQMAFREAAPKAGEKAYRFVSSQSPLKNADPGTDEGAKAVQGTIDAMAQVFVNTVARNRGVATETVLKDFGKGGILVGQDAVSAGMADSVGSFESVLAELSAGRKAKGKGASMADELITAEDVAKAEASAASMAIASERARTAGLRTLASAFNAEDAMLTAAINSGATVEAFAMQIAEAAEAAKVIAAKAEADKAAAALASLSDDEAEAEKVKASNGNEPGEATVESVANQILADAGLLGDK